MADNQSPTAAAISWGAEVWRQTPVIAILLAILITNLYGLWFSRASYNEMRAERDVFRSIALDSVKVLDAVPPATAARASEPSPTPSPRPRSAPQSASKAIAKTQVIHVPVPKPSPTPTPAPVVVEIKKRLREADAVKKP